MDTLERSYSYGTSPLTSELRSSPLRTYLFGAGHITHSHSPRILSALYEASGIPWTYDLAITTDRDEFKKTVSQPDCIGASVTMPNKVEFISVMDHITDEARVIGAINTVFIRLDKNKRRRYIGTNTDCIGIRDALLHRYPNAAERSRNKPALVIGGGGAARSAIYALWEWFKPSEIYLVNRLKSEVDAIITEMASKNPNLRLRYVDSVESAQALPAPILAVGTIPDHAPVSPEEKAACDVYGSLLRQGQNGILVEMCYMPARTRLTALVEERGWKTVPGTEVLARVGIAQNTLWQEQIPNLAGQQEVMRVVSLAARL